MQPAFKIIANQQDITAKIADRLLELSIQQEVKDKADLLTLKLDNRPPYIQIPATGMTLQVYLGYKNQALHDMGLYYLDEYQLTGPPHSILIRARSANFKDSLKAPKLKSWDNIRLKNLVSQIAKENDFKAEVESKIAQTHIAHLDQTAESDVHFLTRIAKSYGFNFKVKNNTFVISSGKVKSKEVITIDFKDVQRYQYTHVVRDQYGAAVATWYDIDEASEQFITAGVAGSNNPTYLSQQSYASQAVAELGIQSMKIHQKKAHRVELIIPKFMFVSLNGNVELLSSPIPENNYHIEQLKFELNTRGFLTNISLSKEVK